MKPVMFNGELMENYFVDIAEGRIFSNKKGKLIELKLANTRGYHHVSLSKNNNKINARVHRIVVETREGKVIPKELVVNHINEIKTDNRSCNLEIVTISQNINHGTANERRRFNNSGDNSRFSKDTGYYSVNPVLRATFRRSCKRQGWNFNDFIETVSGIYSCKGKSRVTYIYNKKGVGCN